MTGITSFGAYVPLQRLSRKELERAWGRPAIAGEKAVANIDEDSLTMAVEAAIDCLGGRDRQTVDGLYFATASPPYLEKQNASIIAAAVDLTGQVASMDFGHSLRGATCAFAAALDAVKAGSRRSVLVTTADCRVAAPSSELEPLLGDGAAAFLIGDENVAVEVAGHYSVSSEFMDLWRRDSDLFHRTWEDRFVLGEGYAKIAKDAITGFLEQSSLSVQEFTRVVYNAPDPKAHSSLARSLGINARQLQDPLFESVGNAGTAASAMMLVAALEQAQPDDSILWANYGDGCDVYHLRVTGQIAQLRQRRGIGRHLASKRMLGGYERYAQIRNLLARQSENFLPDQSSLTVLWREREQILRCYGSRCRQCGEVQYPAQRICAWCQSKDDFEPTRLSDRRGKIFTFSMDERAMALEMPNVIAIVDFDGGGRFYSVVADRDPETLRVGQSVELTLRKLHDGHGIHNYFWKARPVRCLEENRDGEH